MNKHFLLIAFVLASIPSFAEQYTCSYPSYFGGKKQIILKIHVKEKTATVDKNEYLVLQNSELGIVLARSFAQHNKYTNADDLGLFGITINKKTFEFTRGTVADGEASNSIAKGNCIKD